MDVGGEYDVSRKRFDHHQRGFDQNLQGEGLGSGTKLSSAGLVYRHYGRDIIRSILRASPLINFLEAGSTSQADERPPASSATGAKDAAVVRESDIELLYRNVYVGFVEHIDGIDNGINAFSGERNYDISTTLSARVGSLNPAWNEGN